MFAIKIFFWPHFKGNVDSHNTLLEQAACFAILSAVKNISVLFLFSVIENGYWKEKNSREAFIFNVKIIISSSTAYRLPRSVIRNSAYAFSCWAWEITIDCDIFMYGFMQVPVPK